MLTTQLSLLARLTDPDDGAAWRTFLDIYQPVIYRSLRAKGLQHSDAEDVTQQVLISVARSLEARPHDPNRARFRTWLYRVIRNAAINAIQRVGPDRAAGGSDMQQYINLVPGNTEQTDEQLFDQEHQKQLFYNIAESIQHEFEPATWQAFWRTTVDGESIPAVAADLKKQVGSVYAARSRIIKRFRQEMEAIVDSNDNLLKNNKLLSDS